MFVPGKNSKQFIFLLFFPTINTKTSSQDAIFTYTDTSIFFIARSIWTCVVLIIIYLAPCGHTLLPIARCAGWAELQKSSVGASLLISIAWLASLTTNFENMKNYLLNYLYLRFLCVAGEEFIPPVECSIFGRRLLNLRVPSAKLVDHNVWHQSGSTSKVLLLFWKKWVANLIWKTDADKLDWVDVSPAGTPNGRVVSRK